MPTGVSVSASGRIFVCYPKWGDDVPATVTEIRDGQAVPYPDQAWNSPSGDDDAEAFVSVQSIVVDPADRLWVLDPASPMFQPTKPGGPKLVCVDLSTDTVAQTIAFEPTSRWIRPTSMTSASTCGGARPAPPSSRTRRTREPTASSWSNWPPARAGAACTTTPVPKPGSHPSSCPWSKAARSWNARRTQIPNPC